MIIAIIPARGGSKRIQRKNIKSFHGKPIIAYSIISAQESNLFDKIIVSTEDDEIAEIAMKYGADVPFRRSLKNSGDFATTAEVMLEVVEKLVKFDKACCLYPTAPLVSPSLLIRSFNTFENENFDSLFPVTQFSYPIQRALKIENNRIKMFNAEYKNHRSQDLETAYHDCGQFYWFTVDSLKKYRSLYTENSGSIIVNEMETQDIDTIADWKLAELKYEILLNQNG